MKLLAELTEAFAPPGFEDEIRDICRRELEPLVDSIEVDAMGNLIALKRGRLEGERQRIMLAGHMDEIGFLVRYIDDDGFLRLNPAGGFDPKTLIAKRVLVKGKSGKLVGLIGTKPIHIMTADEKSKMPTLDDLFVDLGLPVERVKEEVEVGTPVTLWQRFEQWGDVATCKAMDNRVSMWTIIRALQRTPAPAHDVYAVMTAQEEIGIRGATVAAYGVNPDIGVAVDITLACDVPGVNKKDYITTLGKGVAIKVMDSASISHPGLVRRLRRVAEENEIPYQLEILPRGGTDARGIQMAREGKPAATLSVPTRYVHSVVEMLNVNDLEGTANLLARFLEAESPLGLRKAPLRMRYVLSFVGGLLATPVVTFLLGWLLFGRRDTWNVGQGESFLTFIVALYAAPIGAVYWTLVTAVQKWLGERVSGGRVFLVALIVFVTALNFVLWAVDRNVF